MSTLADALRGGGKFVKWDDLGTGVAVSGTVQDVTVRQARKFESIELDYWDDGTAKMQAVVSIGTDQRDPSDPDDDGTRSITINLWSGQKQALAAACRAAGVAEPTAGDTFTAVWTSGVGRAKDPRVFTYTVTPGSGLGAALGAPAPVVEQRPAPQWAAPATAAPEVPVAESKPDQVKTLHSAGLPVAQIAQITGYSPEAVAALINVA